MKRILLFSFMLLLCCCLTGCKDLSNTNTYTGSSITDIRGNSFIVADNARVVSCYGSFADMWQLSGGNLVGVTKDAVEEHCLELSNDVQIIGTVKEINLEKLVSLNPDYVILSEDIATHHSMEEGLKTMNIPYGYFRVDSFSDYQNLMKQFCDINKRPDLYEENVLAVKDNINTLLGKIPENRNKTFLLMRSFSTGIKVKNDNLAADMLRELGAIDICDKTPSLLKDFSLEQIIKDDPDFIFVLTMGDEDKAKKYLADTMQQNPAWNELSAVKNNRFVILPKDLFHYKPNNRWDESYEYLAKILYPEKY